MRDTEQAEFINILWDAYRLGVQSAEAQRTIIGWTPAKAKRERGALDRLLKRLGIPKLTDEEYAKFNQ